MTAVVDLGPERVADLDVADMLGAIAGLPRQLTAGYAVAASRLGELFSGPAGKAPPSRPASIAICGMGGSAIGGDLVLASLADLAVPAGVVRGYTLPAWVGPQTLVIIVSYSGDTEEALACAEQACARGCVPVCVSSGGRLCALADSEGLPCLIVPGGEQPRASVGYLATPILAVMEAAALCAGHEELVAATAARLRRDGERLGPEIPDSENAAKALARRLEQRLTVVYGAGPTAPVARRWKGQINENAKAPAFFNELPELDHNELMGWTSLPDASASALAVFLGDADGDPRLARRAWLTACEYEARGVATEAITVTGASCLERLFSLVQLGDYVSFYLALLYGVDPTPVDAIQGFKAKLAAGAG